MSLEANIGDLHRRVMRGGYRANPSRRQDIPKPDGRQRPLGIAALEDKVVQRVLMRRSQKAFVPWRRMKLIAARWIPSARNRHPWPQQRFLVKHPRWEPSALAAHARICPGGAG